MLFRSDFHIAGDDAVGPLCGDRFAHHVLRLVLASGTATISVPIGDDGSVALFTAVSGSKIIVFRPESTGIFDATQVANLQPGGRWRDIIVTWSASSASNTLNWESRPAGGAI